VNRPKNQYGDEMALPEICLELHFNQTAPNYDERRTELRAFLRGALEHWHIGPGPDNPVPDHSRFARAVRELCEAALAEGPQ
jgi:hypothetical protein